MNPPENRDTAAEIMFETFNVPGLCIGVQAVLSLYAAFAVAEKGSKVASHLPMHASSSSIHDNSHFVPHPPSSCPLLLLKSSHH